MSALEMAARIATGQHHETLVRAYIVAIGSIGVLIDVMLGISRRALQTNCEVLHPAEENQDRQRTFWANVARVS